MKSFGGMEIYDEAARQYMAGITTSGTGAAYVATVKGIDALTSGVGFTMIPHVNNTDANPTLNVNNLGVKPIRQRISNGYNSLDVVESGLLVKDKPVRLIFDGAFWVIDLVVVDASGLYGTVPINKGGTGATTAAGIRNNLGLGNTVEALPIANGGTGATTQKAALENLGITLGTGPAPSTGKPNTIYIQML